jgi:TonB family protein
METIALYLAKSVVWITGFAAIYYVFLRNERFFVTNRIFLISGIISSLLLPLLTLTYHVDLPAPAAIRADSPEAVSLIPAEHGLIPDIGTVLITLYIIGAAVVAFLFVYKSRAVIRSAKRAEVISHSPVKILRTDEYPVSFSFFSWVFVNPSVSDAETREIVNHEMVHISQKHWADLVLGEVLCTLQWFNPLSWTYIHFMRQNHEFLADEGALQRSHDPAIYRAALLNQVMGVPLFSLSNSFNYSLTKKRFTMMKNIVTSPYRKLRVLLILPVMAAILVAFARPEYRYIQGGEEKKDSSDRLFQDKTVRGIVVQQNGTPLERATIVAQGTTIGTMTDSKGAFTLSRIPEGTNLIVSYIGFSSKVVKPEYSKEIRIVLLRDTLNLPAVQTPPPPPPPPPPFSLKDIPKTTLVIIDGTETSVDLAKLDPDKFAAVILWQGESAITKFGDKGKNGVLELRTKKAAGVSDDDITYYAKPKINKTIIDTVKNSNTDYIKVTEVKEEKPGDKNTFVIVEEMPSFPGGQEALYSWISSNIKYPAIAYKNGIKGQVIVIFVVKTDGSIGNVSIFKGVDPALDNEAIRVVNSMPRWKPGVQSGRKVDVYMKVPIDFKLN